MSFDYNQLEARLKTSESASAHNLDRVAANVVLEASAKETARELLRLRDGVQDIRGTCHLAYKFTTQVDTPEHKAVGANLKKVVNLLDHLLDGDTE